MHFPLASARRAASARILACLLVATSVAGCSAPSLLVTPRVAYVGLDGDFASDTNISGVPTSIDSLGLDEEEAEFAPRVDLTFGGLQWTVDYADFQFVGSGRATADIVIEGVTFEANDDIDTDIELSLLRSLWTWDLVPTDLVDVGLGFGLALADVSVALQDADPPFESASTDEVVPLPFAALRAAVSLGDFGAEAQVGYIDVEVDDVEAGYLDVDAMAYWQFVDAAGAGFRLVGGYRFVDVDAAFEDGSDQVDANLEFSGPYLGLTVVL